MWFYSSQPHKRKKKIDLKIQKWYITINSAYGDLRVGNVAVI